MPSTMVRILMRTLGEIFESTRLFEFLVFARTHQQFKRSF